MGGGGGGWQCGTETENSSDRDALDDLAELLRVDNGPARCRYLGAHLDDREVHGYSTTATSISGGAQGEERVERGKCGRMEKKAIDPGTS